MKIKGCSLKQVRGLPPTMFDFTDPVSGQALMRTVIAGSNGSGKTTILETIGQLLGVANLQNLDWIAWEGMNAELIVAGLPPNINDNLLIRVNPEIPRAQVLPIASLQNHSSLPEIQSHQVEIFDTASVIIEQIQQAEEGKGNYPTCIFFPSENRQLQKKQTGQIIAESTPYEWIYRFTDHQQWPGSLESFLVAMYFRDLIAWSNNYQHTNGKAHGMGEFKQFTALINRFLANKQITGVDRQTFRIQVQGANGQGYGIEQLSSGEKQILLLLGEIQRRIRQGSIVLIDEPELHLHPTWQRQLVSALTDLCAAFDAQLIMTTHSEEIANAVYAHELILLDDIFQSTRSTTPETIPSV